MTRLNLILLLGVLSLALFISCGDDEPEKPEIPNEEEVITTLNYTLTPIGGGQSIVLSFKDLDGDGGNAPTITGGTLADNATYTGTIELLNEAESPVENITEEVEEEALEHQFFFHNNVNGMTISYGDMDDNGNPIGIISNLSTANAASGSLTIILRHEPSKNASGVANGDISNAGGETDIEVTFTINVQ